MSEMYRAGRLQLGGKPVRRLALLGMVLMAVLVVAGVGTLRAQTVPTFMITNVVTDKTVTIETANFPPNRTFTVTMGPFGTQGINGHVVGTMESGLGGKLTATFNIPAQLVGSYSIAIRAQTADLHPFYAYNWFYNHTTVTVPRPTPVPGTPVPTPVPVVVPTITICSVVRDTSVRFVGANFPANQTFTVTMGPFGTQGIGGTVVGTLQSGAGGAVEGTYNIPANMVGSYRIAIRAQTAHAHPYVAYNWFYNTTANVCP